MKLSVTLTSPCGARFYCAGKRVVFGKMNGVYAAELESDGEIVLEIADRPEQLRKGYGWQALLFWIVGIAGFFTPKYGKNCLDLNCALRLERDANLKLNVLGRKDPRATERAVCYESDAPVTEIGKPAYEVSKPARRRRRIYQALSWLARIGIAVAIVFAVI